MMVSAANGAPLWLASRSERRRALLTAADIEFVVEPAGFDDGTLRPGPVEPADWVMSLAYMKARWVADALSGRDVSCTGTVLGADTVCARAGRILGQPADAAHARHMLHDLRDATHTTLTGVCMIELPARTRRLAVDQATVRVGRLDDPTVDAYVDSGEWQGKAGGYNLQDRIDAGWPITCDGDPTTVMGLPMDRLAPWLRPWRTTGPGAGRAEERENGS